MKGNSFKLFLALVVLFMTMIACVSPLGGGGQSAPTLQAAQLPSTLATDTPAPASSSGGKYFQEDFNTNLNNWSQFLVSGAKIAKGGTAELSKSANMSVNVKDGYLVFDLEGQYQWAYAIYNPQDYDDVRLEVSEQNQAINQNNVSLICRYSLDQGWYEFNIENNGLYAIYFAQVQKDGTTVIYSKLADGGYSKIKQGKDTNQLGISCVGHTLTLYINGNQIKQLDDNQYELQSGKIGVAVDSFSDTPATVGFDWVKVSQPIQ